MRKWALLLILFAIPLVGQVEESLRAEIDSLRMEHEETQIRIDSLSRVQQQYNPDERYTKAFEEGTKTARFTLWFVSIIGGVLGLAGVILGFLGFREIWQVRKIREEAKTAEKEAKECALKAKEYLKKIEERTKKLDEVESKVDTLELKITPNIFEGISLLEKDKYEEALGYFDKAIKENPKNAVAWCQKGNCLDDLGRHEEALKSFDEAIRLKPDDAEAYDNRTSALVNWGVRLLEAGKSDEAKEKFKKAKESAEKAIELYKGKEGYYNLTCAQARLGEYDKALESLHESKEKGEYTDFAFVWEDEDLAPLRKSPYRKRFIAIVGPPPEVSEKRKAKPKSTKPKK